jgi:hypothetical protein
VNKGLICVLSFSFGAAIGSFATWKIAKNKYERMAEEQIAELREYYKKKHKPEESKANDEKTKIEVAKENLNETKGEYVDILKNGGYISSTDAEESRDNIMTNKTQKPYVISPDEFGENDYKIMSLTYYADHILADDADEIVEDVDDIVGIDSLDTFGDYEDDSVFVRNEYLETDFEILLDTRNYKDIYPDARK